jgi:hypothetical protein
MVPLKLKSNVFETLHGKQLELRQWTVQLRERYWRAWEKHCKLFPLNERGPNLPPNNIEDMLLTFAVAVREGQHGLGGRIQVQSVEVAL